MVGEVVIVVFPFRVRLPIVILFAPEIAILQKQVPFLLLYFEQGRNY
jgi:hypothetical protein